MGVGIGKLFEDVIREYTIESFRFKTLTIDAFNLIYHYLYSIRDRKGKQFTNGEGKYTSHLIGLFNKNLMMLFNDIKPIWCFDGKNKDDKLRWSGNNKDNDSKPKVDKYVINTSKKLLDFLGISYIQAPSEGEAQCSHLVNNNEAFAVVSDDRDVLLHGSSLILANSFSKSKKIQFISSKQILKSNELELDQLITIGTLIGNDYFSGIKNVGIVSAIKYVTNGNIHQLFDDKTETKSGDKIDYSKFCRINNKYVNMYKKPNVKQKYSIQRSRPKYNKLYKFLVLENNFCNERIRIRIKKLKDKISSKKQTSIEQFFK